MVDRTVVIGTRRVGLTYRPNWAGPVDNYVDKYFTTIRRVEP